jgi:hypothetical protein
MGKGTKKTPSDALSHSRDRYAFWGLILITLALAILVTYFLTGCKPQETKSYAYCMVMGSQKMVFSNETYWITECVDNTQVIFPKEVHQGDQVFYTPYQIDDATSTLYGYIHKVDEVVP